MCSTCGCGPESSDSSHEYNHDHHNHEHHARDKKLISLEKDVLHKNNLLAERNRGFFEAKDIVAINLVSSPGSGKTTLLEKTLAALNKELTFSVIEGDQQTDNDAKRIAAAKVPVIQINTGTGCHLDSEMVSNGVKVLKPVNESILFIENVGNLVCPALFDLGEKLRVAVISVTEGDDKPLKYPYMFQSAHVCIINKIDLLPYVDFDISKAKEGALKVNRELKILELSCRTGEGMQEWFELLKGLQVTKEKMEASVY